MAVTTMQNYTSGANNRDHWSIFDAGKTVITFADTEAEARTEAAKLKDPIVIPPASAGGSNFVTAPSSPPVALTPPAPQNPVGGTGTITATAESIPGGARITVTGQHAMQGEKMNYFLNVKVSGVYYPIKQLLAGEVVNPSSYSSLKTFDIAYAELNQIFASKGAPQLQVTPGTEMAVVAAFPSGHQWGLSAWSRGSGEFLAP